MTPPGAGAAHWQAVPTIPESTKQSIRLRLLTHAEQHWPQLAKVEVTYRGTSAATS